MNKLYKSDIMNFLDINPNIVIEIANPDSTISSKDIPTLIKIQAEQGKILAKIKKSVDNISRAMKHC